LDMENRGHLSIPKSRLMKSVRGFRGAFAVAIFPFGFLTMIGFAVAAPKEDVRADLDRQAALPKTIQFGLAHSPVSSQPLMLAQNISWMKSVQPTAMKLLPSPIIPQNVTKSELAKLGWKAMPSVRAHNNTCVFFQGEWVLKITHAGVYSKDYELGPTESLALSRLSEGLPVHNQRIFPQLAEFFLGELEGVAAHFVVMTHCWGTPFDEHVVAAADHQAVAEVLSSMLDALEWIKSKDIVHRDLDTTNVIVNKNNVVCVIDFALAVGPGFPARGETVGTLGTRGRPPDFELCGYDDVYSAGRMISLALTHRQQNTPPGLQELVFQMTRPNCQDRILDFHKLRALLLERGLTADVGPPCFDVNHYVSKPSVKADGDCLEVKGYQRYSVCRARVTSSDTYLTNRAQALEQIPFSGSSVLDIGGNLGFFSIKALLAGAGHATVIEGDQLSAAAGKEIASSMSLSLEYRHTLSDVNANQFDVVLAFAVVHWLTSCTWSFGSIFLTLGHLAEHAKRFLVVEWIDPADDAITSKKHVGGSLDYTATSFRAGLRTFTAGFRCVLKSRQHRWVYVAVKFPSDLDILNKLPQCDEEET